jgi:tRNA 2-thiouridine synthesizing protein B
MADLYTVNKSPFEKNSLEAVIKFSGDGAAILMMEDGVYGATKGTTADSMITGAGDKKFYAIKSDLMARGIAEDRVIDGVELVDYAGFVDLVENTDKVQAWL